MPLTPRATVAAVSIVGGRGIAAGRPIAPRQPIAIVALKQLALLEPLPALPAARAVTRRLCCPGRSGTGRAAVHASAAGAGAAAAERWQLQGWAHTEGGFPAAATAASRVTPAHPLCCATCATGCFAGGRGGAHLLLLRVRKRS